MLTFMLRLSYKSTMTLPPFTDEGLLPPGDHLLSFNELRDSFLVTGEGCDIPEWDRFWRSHLVDNLERLTKELWTVGIERVFIDGSFVERKAHPNDIDGYFDVEMRYFICGKLHKDLNLLNEHKIWTWDPGSQKNVSNFAKRQLPMWLMYRIELYPHYGQITGLTDRYGNDLVFPSAFRQRRSDNQQKGIVLLRQASNHD